MRNILPHDRFTKFTFFAFALILLSVPLFEKINFTKNQHAAQDQSTLDVTDSDVSSEDICPPTQGKYHCLAKIITDTHGKRLSFSSPGKLKIHDTHRITSNFTPKTNSTGPYDAYHFHTLYNLPCTPGGAEQTNCNPSTFGPQTIAIIDAFNNTAVESDLGTYDQVEGLPSCTRANGCLQILNYDGTGQTGGIVDPGWLTEADLDVQTAHALCQTCKIMLIDAQSDSDGTLFTAINTAVNLGAKIISLSWGGDEQYTDVTPALIQSDLQQIDASYLNHPGVAIVAASGDKGYYNYSSSPPVNSGVTYPASSPYTISVAGTSLYANQDYTYNSELPWLSTGSGCSLYERAQSWQLALSNWAQTGCGQKRAVADVSADADPNTGVFVYSPIAGSSNGWIILGGTSLAAPIIASTIALTGNPLPNNTISSLPYVTYNSTNFHDITTGQTASCGTVMCNSVPGYDGPTGLGSPNGIAAFTGATSTPTPTVTSTPTISPTPTLSYSGIGLSISPQSVNISIVQGGVAAALTLTSQGATSFNFNSSPTSQPGINWNESGGGISPGNSLPIHIQVNNNVPVGIYSGTAILENPVNMQQLSIPITVTVTSPSLTPTQVIPTLTQSQGDANGDGVVNILDLSFVGSEWQQTGSNLAADFNHDNVVNILDLSTIGSNWLK